MSTPTEEPLSFRGWACSCFSILLITVSGVIIWNESGNPWNAYAGWGQRLSPPLTPTTNGATINFYCEGVKPNSIIRQPWNCWSNIFFLLFGIIIFHVGVYDMMRFARTEMRNEKIPFTRLNVPTNEDGSEIVDPEIFVEWDEQNVFSREKGRKRRMGRGGTFIPWEGPLINAPWISLMYGICLVVLSCGSFLMHSSICVRGERVEWLGIIVTLWIVMACPIQICVDNLVMNYSRAWYVLSFLNMFVWSWVGVYGTVEFFVFENRLADFVVEIGIGLSVLWCLVLYCSWMQDANSRVLSAYFAALAGVAICYLIQSMSSMCHPDGFLRWHALYQIATAVAFFLYWMWHRY